MNKPFKTTQEQIAILESRGLITDDKTDVILRREGYYSVINGYKDIFIDPESKSKAGGDDRFLEDVTFVCQTQEVADTTTLQIFS